MVSVKTNHSPTVTETAVVQSQLSNHNQTRQACGALNFPQAEAVCVSGCSKSDTHSAYKEFWRLMSLISPFQSPKTKGQKCKEWIKLCVYQL